MSDSTRQEIKDIRQDVRDIKSDVKEITSWFTRGDVRLVKDCLQTLTSDEHPVRQKEFRRLEKLVWWIIGIVITGGGGAVAIAKFL